MPEPAAARKLAEVAALFLKLGLTAFGGPAAHTAMMEQELVRRRHWLSEQDFLDLMGATNLIPGPNSTELAMLCGHARAGILGLVLAGCCFILPAALITGLLAWLYVGYGSLPALQPWLAGIAPAVLAIIAGALLSLRAKALKSPFLIAISTIMTIAVLLGLPEVLAILFGGLLGMLWPRRRQKVALWAVLPLTTPSHDWPSLFWPFFKIGALLFGSGYALVAYLDAELVQQLGWLSRQQLLDAVAVGQFTPGPVLSTATFLGFLLGGPSGAVAATAGIFLPSFVFSALVVKFLPRLRESAPLSRFLDAVNASAWAVMLAVLIKLGLSVLIDWRSLLIAALSVTILLRWPRFPAFWLVPAAALSDGLLKLLA